MPNRKGNSSGMVPGIEIHSMLRCATRTLTKDAALFVMDSVMIQQQFAQAERRAVGGRQLVARQERLITELDRDGHDTAAARKVLATLKEAQALHEQDVDRLREELRAASQP